MNRAKAIFRSFFAEGELGREDLEWFIMQHGLDEIDEPNGHAVCTRTDRLSHPQSYEGKPALVMVFEKGSHDFQIEWWNEHKQLHRTDGPAKVIAFRNGHVIGNWIENGVRKAGPLALKDEHAAMPLPLSKSKKPKGRW